MAAAGYHRDSNIYLKKMCQISPDVDYQLINYM